MKPARPVKTVFANEAALCATFIAALPEGWTAYPETAGFDIVLVRQADGAQIGVEAKMTLNAKVLLQAVEGMHSQREAGRDGPDFRAALVPQGAAGAEMRCIARYLGVTVIECRDMKQEEEAAGRQFDQWQADSWPEDKREAARARWVKSEIAWRKKFDPDLPAIGGYDWRGDWTDHCPAKRCKLPDYVPDVVAGASGPSSLSDWKIKAIKICILLERRGWVAIDDFKRLEIDRRRWLEMGWLQGRDGFRGHYVQGPYVIGLREQHPVNYVQIEADYEKWAPADEPAALGLLL